MIIEKTDIKWNMLMCSLKLFIESKCLLFVWHCVKSPSI